MERRTVIALVCAVSTAGCLETVEQNGEEITEPTDIEIVWHDLVRDDPGTEDERVYVWGLVRNSGDRSIQYVEIRATFYDEEGEELDTVIENAENLTEGEEWEFEIEFPRFGEEARAVADYELEPATGI